jgi:hypothetical protein
MENANSTENLPSSFCVAELPCRALEMTAPQRQKTWNRFLLEIVIRSIKITKFALI